MAVNRRTLKNFTKSLLSEWLSGEKCCFKNLLQVRKKIKKMELQIYLRLYERYGLTAGFSINVIFGYCRHMNIFTAEYLTYGRRNEEVMSGNPFSA